MATVVDPYGIRDGQNSDFDALVETLSDSFSRDPVMNWVIPRTRFYPDFFSLLLREVYYPRGLIHLDRDHRAAALWLPPEQRFQIAPRLSLLQLMARLMLVDGPRVLWRVRAQGQAFSRFMPVEPHYYLQFIGCRSEHQGRGIGSALLKQGTRVCDERGMPAYLESSNILNVPLYQRHGFEVIGEETLGNKGPRAWFMWREAR